MDVHPTMKVWKESTYAETLEKLVKLSCMEERKLTGFAENLKNIEGQKHVFFFFQRRLIPAWGSMTASGFFDDSVAFSERLIDFYYPQNYFDMDKIKGAFADSSISCHFLYITERSRNIFSDMEMNPAEEGRQRVDWFDGTLDFFNTFKEIANATGGITESSVNANFCLKKAARVSESYYLLYYIPKNYVADGKFKKIEVKVKGKKYRVTHRAGYIAD
jgi:hypothetical protein